jgi:hypothetical protein
MGAGAWFGVIVGRRRIRGSWREGAVGRRRRGEPRVDAVYGKASWILPRYPVMCHFVVHVTTCCDLWTRSISLDDERASSDSR